MCASMTERNATAATGPCARVLDVQDLRVVIRNEGRELVPVAGVSFHVDEGETLALVGESGAGKSVSALSVMRLTRAGSSPDAVRIEGSIRFHERDGTEHDLVTASAETMRSIRGRAISMVFQEPMTSLNPVLRIGDQIAEAIVAHEAIGWNAATTRATEMLGLVGIPDPEMRRRTFPHELSGGMRQRVMIAIALSCRPRLLIADEPTTALDVTIQGQVLELIRRLQRELNMAVLFITHDLGVVAQMADRVAVMYSARIVEQAPIDAFFASPLHPYSVGLLRSMPNPSAQAIAMVRPIPGTVPSLSRLPQGCAFHPRCERADGGRCVTEQPSLEASGAARAVSCWHWRTAGAAQGALA
jgi:oligopeptide/dipeptide ABC transporter ATP-binding protein